ncbi:MAG: TIR domain-containing protein [Chitinophagales bacterium]
MKNDDKKVIVREAKYFYNRQIKEENIDNQLISRIKTRLEDFYTPEGKALFLNTIQVSIKAYLKQRIEQVEELENNRVALEKKNINVNSRVNMHSKYIEKRENLLFYIQQELDTLPLFDISQRLDELLAKAKTERKNISDKRNKVFICYNRNNTDYKDDIKRYFKPFLPADAVWCDDNIKASEVWSDEIYEAISETKVAIFLVSTDFLASDFVMDKEVPTILKAVEKGHTIPLFIILEPCLFTDIPALSKYQTVNPPTQAISQMDENEKKALFVNLVRLTREVLNYGNE